MSRRHASPATNGGAADAVQPDLAAELLSARYDLLLLRDAFLAAWRDDLGYGPRGVDYSRQRGSGGDDPAVRNVPLRWGPEGDPWSPRVAHRVREAVELLAQAQHDYGDLEGGQTVWPRTVLEGRQVDLEEALQGQHVLRCCVEQLIRYVEFLSEDDQAVALKVARGCREALRVMPEQLWRRQVGPSKPKCLDCGRDVQDSARRCYACRPRLSRSVRAEMSRRSA